MTEPTIVLVSTLETTPLTAMYLEGTREAIDRWLASNTEYTEVTSSSKMYSTVLMFAEMEPRKVS